MQYRIDPTNLGEVLACAGIARLAWLADPAGETGFQGDSFTAPDVLLHDILPSLNETPFGLQLCGYDIDWWQPWGTNPGLKNWSGQQTPVTVHRHSVEQAQNAPATQWRTYTAPARGQLYVDTLSMWDTLGIGWSPNEHATHQVAARPWLELLASLGLQAFPVAGNRSDGFIYHLWQRSSLPVAIAAFTGHGPGVYSERAYRAPTDKSGKVTYLLPARPL